MNTNTSIGLSLFMLGALTLAGCKREEDVAPEEDHAGMVHTVDLRLKLVWTYGTHDYELASEYTDDLGHLYKLDTARFYLSNLDVIDDETNVLASYTGLQLMADAAGNNDFALGSLTASHAHQIRFVIGLPPALNDSDPSVAGPPLNAAAMHWGMAADEGYWFLVLTGRIDSDNSGTLDATDQVFAYRCGTDALARSGWAPMHVEIPDGGTLTVEAAIDVERLMGGVDVLANSVVVGSNALNVQLMDSLQSIFHESH